MFRYPVTTSKSISLFNHDNILCIEDEPTLLNLIASRLQEAGFKSFKAYDSLEAQEILDQAIDIDLIVLDIMLPGMDGIEFLQHLRRASINIPVIILTARGSFQDQLLGFEAGADDYMIKPFHVKILLLRIESLLRRSNSKERTLEGHHELSEKKLRIESYYEKSKRNTSDKEMYGKLNEHNALIPRDHWLEPWERQAILAYHEQHPLDGYRRLTYRMMDDDVVAVSPSSVYRVLRQAGVLDRWSPKPSKKGTGFVPPLLAHAHWHVDIAYVNLCGTFYYLCSILDGYSRSIVHWALRETMTEADIELIIQQALERYPDASPRIISDNGPQFIARDFKDFIRLAGLSHVRTSPYYPQSNGKLERYHRSIKSGCIRPGQFDTLAQANTPIARYVEHYNTERLHSAIGYMTPTDKLVGNEKAIHQARETKLAAAREQRRLKRLRVHQDTPLHSATA